MDLSKIRKEIDSIDEEIVECLSRRIKLIPEIVNYKKEHDMKMHQPDREKEVIERIRKIGEEKGLDPGYVEELFRRIMKESHRKSK